MIRTPGVAALWWRELNPPDQSRTGSARATLARLRRCASVSEAMLEVAVMQLFRRVQADNPLDLPVVALTASVLAHVRAEPKEPTTVARMIGPKDPNAPETALVKPLRFRRLMEADAPDERLTVFRRLVALAGGTLPVDDLAHALLGWTERRRQRWVYAYWDAGPAPGERPAPPDAIKDTVP